jgi:peptidylprolyl isomerase
MSDLIPNPDGSSPPRQKFDAAPPMIIDTAKTYGATMVTSHGTMEILLDALAAPQTVNSFVFLARWHYYDGVILHRIIPGFVLQGGDPTGSGAGGPGYRFNDELQFFIISGPDGMRLPPLYALFGKVVKGIDVVTAIDAIGTPSGKPRERVVIESVTITESES